MSAITAKASRKMKKYAVLTREPRCFLGSFDFSWEQRKLGDIADIVGGGTPSTGNQSYWDGDIDWYAPAEIADQIYANSSQKKITGLGYENSSAKMLPPGTVLFTSRAGIGKTAILTRKGCTNQGFQSIVPHRGELDSYFIFSRTEELKRYGELVGAGSTFVEVSGKQMAVMELMMPPTMREQQTIGGFFQQLDHLITLHQRKCANLCSPSQVVFSLLFATSTFSWEQRKLEDYLTVSAEKNTGNIYGRSDVLSVSGDYGIVNQIEFQGRSFAGASVSNYGVVQTGDVVYTKSPLNSNPYGIIKTNKGKPGIVSTLYAVYHPKENAFSDFIQVYFEQHARMNNYMHPLVNKGAKNDMKVSAENALKGPVCFPSRIEQESISAFFSVLDNLITLHQRECISFTGRADRLILTANKKRTTSSWEQRKFEEIAVRSSVICSDDTLPRVEYEDIVSGTGRLNKDIYAKQSIKSGIAFHQGDVLYGKLRPYLQNWLLPTFDGLAVGDFWVLQPQNADSSFLYRLIQSRQFDEVANQSTGTKMPRADWKLVSKTVFSIPSNIREQAAIGTYFTALDSLITLHQRKPFLMKWRTSDANRNQTNRLVL